VQGTVGRGARGHLEPPGGDLWNSAVTPWASG